MTLQVVSRAHRMGATRPVTVELLVMRGTAEERLLRLVEGATASVSEATSSDGSSAAAPFLDAPLQHGAAHAGCDRSLLGDGYHARKPARRENMRELRNAFFRSLRKVSVGNSLSGVQPLEQNDAGNGPWSNAPW
jgi:hypothetical protein